MSSGHVQVNMIVIPSENASPARTEGSRRETVKLTLSGSFGSASLRYG